MQKVFTCRWIKIAMFTKIVSSPVWKFALLLDLFCAKQLCLVYGPSVVTEWNNRYWRWGFKNGRTSMCMMKSGVAGPVSRPRNCWISESKTAKWGRLTIGALADEFIQTIVTEKFLYHSLCATRASKTLTHQQKEIRMCRGPIFLNRHW